MVLKKVIIFSLMKLLKTTMLQGEYIWSLMSYLSVTVAKVIPVVSVTFFVMIIVSELQTPSIPFTSIQMFPVDVLENFKMMVNGAM